MRDADFLIASKILLSKVKRNHAKYMLKGKNTLFRVGGYALALVLWLRIVGRNGSTSYDMNEPDSRSRPSHEDWRVDGYYKATTKR